MNANTWTDFENFTAQWSPTDDPRIVAVIRTDSEPVMPWGDGQAPTLYGYDYGSRASYNTPDGGDATGIAAAYQRALEHFDENVAQRFLRIFYGVTAHYYLRSNVDQYSYAHVWDAPSWRESVGLSDDAHVDRSNIAGEAQAYLNQEVYGIGYAVNPERVTDETEIPADLDGWDVTMTSWGYYGEDYAREAAAALEEAPELPVFLF